MTDSKISDEEKVIDLGINLHGEVFFGSPDNEAAKQFIETELFATISTTVLLLVLVYAMYLEKKRRDHEYCLKINQQF